MYAFLDIKATSTGPKDCHEDEDPAIFQAAIVLADTKTLNKISEISLLVKPHFNHSLDYLVAESPIYKKACKEGLRRYEAEENLRVFLQNFVNRGYITAVGLFVQEDVMLLNAHMPEAAAYVWNVLDIEALTEEHNATCNRTVDYSMPYDYDALVSATTCYEHMKILRDARK